MKKSLKFYLLIMWCGFLPSAIYLVEKHYNSSDWPIMALYMSVPIIMHLDTITSAIYKSAFKRRIKQTVPCPQRREKDLLVEKKKINTYA